MKKIDLKPLQILIDKHNTHKSKYITNFRGKDLVIHPGILNPNYTKVSGFLSDNVLVPDGAKVLDMFCGSGAIGLAHSNNTSTLLEVDISKIAIRNVEENINNLCLQNKVKCRISDVWENIGEDEKFDVIIANPPLLPISPNTEFEKNFADSEEMVITKKFITGCPKHLTKNGVAYIATSTTSNTSSSKDTSGDIAIKTGLEVGLNCEVVAELNAGYELYRIIRIS